MELVGGQVEGPAVASAVVVSWPPVGGIAAGCGQPGAGMAAIRSNAAVIWVVQGQVAGMCNRRRRCPRMSRREADEGREVGHRVRCQHLAAPILAWVIKVLSCDSSSLRSSWVAAAERSRGPYRAVDSQANIGRRGLDLP